MPRRRPPQHARAANQNLSLKHATPKRALPSQSPKNRKAIGLDFWDQAEVEAALGAELADVLPELLRLDDLNVRIPRMEIVALERIAVRDGRSVDAVLARELRDLVSAESAWLGNEIPGFAAAFSWPDDFMAAASAAAES